MAKTKKKGVLLPVVLDRRYVRSDEECSVGALYVSDFAIQESVRADRSGDYHAAPVSIEKSRIADSVYFLFGDCAGLLLASVLGTSFGWISGASFSIDSWMFLILPIWLMIASGIGLYPGWGLTSVDELRKVTTVSGITYLTVILILVFTELTLNAGLMAFGFSFVFSVIFAISIRNRVAEHLTTSGLGGQTTVIYGASTVGRQVLAAIYRDTRSGLIPVAFLDDDPGKWGQKVDGIPVLGDTNLVIPEASAAVVALPRSSTDNLDSLLKGPLSYYQRIVSIPEWDTLSATSVQPFDEGRFFGLDITKSPMHPDKQSSKRFLDIVVTMFAAPFWIPIGIIAALVIWVDSRENPLKTYVIKNERKQQFRVYRFAPSFRFLAFFRRTGLEHLPALLNVFGGTLTLVGPAPWEFAPSSLENSTPFSPSTIRPGLTGLSNPPISFFAAADEIGNPERYYVRHWSIWLDLIVLGRGSARLFKSWIGLA